MKKSDTKRRASSEKGSSSASSHGAAKKRASSRSAKRRSESGRTTRTVTREEAEAEIAAFDWSKIDALTDEQLDAAAAADPDNPDTSSVPTENWQQFYPRTDLKVLRHRLGMSPREFALTYGISKPILDSWEKGEVVPRSTALLMSGVLSLYLALIAAHPKEMARLVDSLDRRLKTKAEAAE